MRKDNPAIVFTETGAVDIKNLEVPECKDDEVLIKTNKTMISIGTELTFLKGENVEKGSSWDKKRTFPFYPGYNNIGVVLDVGKSLDKGLIGKKVATYGRHCMYFTYKPEAPFYNVRDDVSDEYAVFFTFAQIALNAVRKSGVRLGDNVAVFGMGLLGQFTVEFCRLSGAKNIFAIDISDKRLDCAKEIRNVIPINSSNEDIVSVVNETTRGRMCDIVFEVTGVSALIPEEFKILKKQGRFIVLSSPKGKTLFDFHDLCNEGSYTIIGVHNLSHPICETPENQWTMARNAEYFFDIAADDEINLKRLITKNIKYKDAPAVYQKLMKNSACEMGIIIDWS